MAIAVRPVEFKHADRMFGEHQQARTIRESEWQVIADVFMPRKDFTLPQRPTELRRRRLTSSVPGMALRRGAALLMAYLINHTMPFVKANVDRGLIAAGRPADLEGEARDYLSRVEWQVFDAMMLPESRFLTSCSRLALELCAFGSGVQWTGRKRGFGPKYLTRPLRACWFSENEDGDVDTLFFQFTLPLWKAVQRWPDHGIKKWSDDVGDEAKARQHVTCIHAVFPRLGGVEGAEVRAKPFAEVYLCQDGKAVLEERGYDSFPYSVPRLGVEEGSAYGTGLAWHVLPEALVLHNLTQLTENAVGLKVDPVLMVPKRMFGKTIDRRQGATNQYDAAGLGFQDASKAVQKLEIAGDVTVGAGWLARLEQNVEQAFFTDWMRLRESGNMTAEEVRERRDLRIRTMSGFVPEIDRDWMGKTADRTLEALVEEGILRTAPRQLAGVDVDWDYAGPLAIAQLRGQVDAFATAGQLAAQANEIEPGAAYVFNMEEGLREVGEALALPPGTMRDRKTVADLRERDRKAQELAQNAELAKQAGQALQAGGQGTANLVAANEMQEGRRTAA